MVSIKKPHFNKGRKHTAEAKKKISRAHKGRKHTAASKENMSVAQKGNTNALGYKHTAEAKKKVSEANIGNTKHLGRKHTNEAKKKVSEANIGNTYNLGRKHSAVSKENMSAAKKKLWKDSGYRESQKDNTYLKLLEDTKWDGEKFMSCGYVVICTGKIWRYEHRFIMEVILGRPLSEGEIVHHINEVKIDNRPENLYLCKDQKEHMKIHRILEKGYKINKLMDGVEIYNEFYDYIRENWPMPKWLLAISILDRVIKIKGRDEGRKEIIAISTRVLQDAFALA